MFNFYSNRNGNKGFSLIEVMVALGVMSIVALGFATMMQNQTNDLKAADEKMEMLSIQTQLSNVLSSPAFCGCFIGNNTLNYPTKTWNGFPTAIGASYDAGCAMIGGPLLSVGTQIGRLLPTAMNMQNITETIANSGLFSANLVLQFDQTLLTRSRKPLTVPMYFKVDKTVPANSTLVSCSSGSTGGTPYDPVAACLQIGGAYNAAATPPCNPTYK